MVFLTGVPPRKSAANRGIKLTNLLKSKFALQLSRGIVAALAFLGLVVLIVTFTPLVNWWARQLAGPWRDPKGDVLIILGADDSDEGILGQGSYLRGKYAIRAYREGSFRTLVLSGGGIPVPVAVGMRDFLESHGVPRSAILLDQDSMSTRENALRVRDLVAATLGKKVLMTSDYHMYRAIRFFAKPESTWLHVRSRMLSSELLDTAAGGRRLATSSRRTLRSLIIS